MKDLGTIRWIFIHHATIAKFLNETFFTLDIGVRNVTDLVGMEAIPTYQHLSLFPQPGGD